MKSHLSDLTTWPTYLITWPTYLTYLPTWPTYLTCLTDLHTRPTWANHLQIYLFTFFREHPWGAIIEICDIWDTDYSSDNWDLEFMTIFVNWQLRMTVDSIRNSFNVFIPSLKSVEAFIVWNSAFIHWETLSEHVYIFTFIHWCFQSIRVMGNTFGAKTVNAVSYTHLTLPTTPYV